MGMLIPSLQVGEHEVLAQAIDKFEAVTTIGNWGLFDVGFLELAGGLVPNFDELVDEEDVTGEMVLADRTRSTRADSEEGGRMDVVEQEEKMNVMEEERRWTSMTSREEHPTRVWEDCTRLGEGKVWPWATAQVIQL